MFKIYVTQVNRKNPKNDVNVSDVWARNITGEGVTVAIVDDGKLNT